MKTPTAGQPGAVARTAAPAAPYVPAHYLRRVARSIVLRAAVRGRLPWRVALPLLDRLEGGAR